MQHLLGNLQQQQQAPFNEVCRSCCSLFYLLLVDGARLLKLEMFSDDLSDGEQNNNNAGDVHDKNCGSPISDEPPSLVHRSAHPMQASQTLPNNWYGKPEMLPFLSLCSRYSSGPWAGLLQQTIKEKQKLSSGTYAGKKYLALICIFIMFKIPC